MYRVQTVRYVSPQHKAGCESCLKHVRELKVACTGELAYDGPLYARPLAMTDDMLGPSPMHIKYVSYVYGGPIFMFPLSPSYAFSPVFSLLWPLRNHPPLKTD